NPDQPSNALTTRNLPIPQPLQSPLPPHAPRQYAPQHHPQQPNKNRHVHNNLCTPTKKQQNMQIKTQDQVKKNKQNPKIQ
ncbi:hypothetical protein ACQWF3_25465, partial [Salmonella enterica subsp. enterica serovar Infantis]